jgi:hypothetical protein
MTTSLERDLTDEHNTSFSIRGMLDEYMPTSQHLKKRGPWLQLSSAHIATGIWFERLMGMR